MIIFKCKMCGGDLEIDEQMAVGTCQNCGSTMTLPKASEEKVTSLFNRANHYRRNSEFDKAIKVYENILNEDNLNAEAYWGLVLCKYGIEYVEDPATGQRIPTCHRAQKTSVFLDVDYKQALEYADAPARQIYEAEAAAIDAIQKQILAISEQEEPYDIFICYKETSATGNRTKDSVLAQDIYFSLTEQGYKVFFSKITLEDKLGSAYEPYIFAALNSSKVMIAVATSAEHVSAVWTKNEWSRYLALINKGEKKTLIPVYRDMDPYDLPEEFSHLQALDMGKLGFIQDLTRGVKKILDITQGQTQTTDTHTVGVVSTGASTESLLKRAFICLEDGEWNKADELLERTLDIDPENAKAYIGKLMVDLQVAEEQALGTQTKPLSQSKNYDKALRFANDNYKTVLLEYDKLARLSNERNKFINSLVTAKPLYISYNYGKITLADLPIGATVVDTSWAWEFLSGSLFRRAIVKPVTWIIVAKNHYDDLEPHVTLLSEEVIRLYTFDNSTNRRSSNHWGDSGTANATRGLRPWLNSSGIYHDEGFYKTCSDSFKKAMIKTALHNIEWEHGNDYSTIDHVFIPSTTELGDSNHSNTYQIGTTYKYFSDVGDSQRIVSLGNKATCYGSRSPDSSRGDCVRLVYYNGAFDSCTANFNLLGVRPVLNMKSGTLVSEVEKQK